MGVEPRRWASSYSSRSSWSSPSPLRGVEKGEVDVSRREEGSVLPRGGLWLLCDGGARVGGRRRGTGRKVCTERRRTRGSYARAAKRSRDTRERCAYSPTTGERLHPEKKGEQSRTGSTIRSRGGGSRGSSHGGSRECLLRARNSNLSFIVVMGLVR
jgi:hypothetical protein